MLKMVIDGKEVQVAQGKTLLDAAREAGFEIPTLCHHEKLSPYGACRLCSVEIVTGKRNRIVASCIYLAEEGLEVKTSSPRVLKIRKVLLELLMATSPGGEVAKLAAEYGADPKRYAKKTTFCILCGLCVRYCSNIKKENALGFIGRGVEREVVLLPEIASISCLSCAGECFALCPTCIIPNKFTIALPSFGEKYPTLLAVRVNGDDVRPPG